MIVSIHVAPHVANAMQRQIFREKICRQTTRIYSIHFDQTQISGWCFFFFQKIFLLFGGRLMSILFYGYLSLCRFSIILLGHLYLSYYCYEYNAYKECWWIFLLKLRSIERTAFLSLCRMHVHREVVFFFLFFTHFSGKFILLKSILCFTFTLHTQMHTKCAIQNAKRHQLRVVVVVFVQPLFQWPIHCENFMHTFAFSN